MQIERNRPRTGTRHASVRGAWRAVYSRRAGVLLAALCLTAIPRAAHAHIRLESSAPARDEVISASPAYLQLRFSAHIEGRYTEITLTGPDGSDVALGRVSFVRESDREIRVPVPVLAVSGRYTVHWRTAGADGHVIEGTYAFVLATAAGGASESAPVATPSPPQDAADVHDHDSEPASPTGLAGEIARGLHFVALLLVLGGIALRVLLLPRLRLGDVTRAVVAARAWRAVTAGALLLAAAAVLRLWLQSIALHGAERAWSSPLLSIMLRDTAWGRAWLLQAFFFALLGMAIVWARPRRDRVAALVAVPAALGLSVIPGLSGHAAAAELPARLALVNDTVHVIAAGAWLGTLAVLIVLAIPAIVRLETDGDAAAADAVDRFSPLALSAASLVAITGFLNALMHFSALSQLWTTAYGRTLLLKLIFVAAVGAAGFVNWRWIRPGVRAANGTRRLRLSAAVELGFAALVLAATAVLTGLPRP